MYTFLDAPAGLDVMPLRQFAPGKIKKAIGKFLHHHGINQRVREKISPFAKRIGAALPPNGGRVISCGVGRMIDPTGSCSTVLLMIVRPSAQSRPVGCFGPWLWFGECAGQYQRSLEASRRAFCKPNSRKKRKHIHR